MFFLPVETKAQWTSCTLSASPPLPHTHFHLFRLPQLIHIVTPFNRGQAVKDPITEVKHTFQIFSVDFRVWTTNFMWKCIEIGGGFMRGAKSVERRERWRGWGGKAQSEWKGQSWESASASSVNVIARMWKMRRRGSRAERKVRACLTQNNWLEDGLIRPLNQLPSLSLLTPSFFAFFFPLFYSVLQRPSSWMLSNLIFDHTQPALLPSSRWI